MLMVSIILNPSKAELENSSLDLVVAGTKDAVLMVESETSGLSEEIMLDAVKFGHEGFVPVIEMIEELAKECRKPEWTVEKKDLSEVKQKLESEFTAKVDVNDEGVVTVAAPDEESRNIAMQFIKDITAKAELNKIYSGKVMKIMEFGAFVNFLGKQDGLVHISELADKRVAKVTDVVKEGDEVKVKVIGFDRGKVKLSMKQATE